ncbi:MAG: GNAT family N-acetyltransferase [Actinobacteria bacterium]|uniref:Unannotated protein n=1 Tax=freshwater metagenome TaxID=449393 RepID=A0A6J6RKD4_9ZZZZ|nr:GNAT family N-acetyltransferase [Actinomycetota bacterium]
MTDAPEAHGLGPHVVGLRVVVRRIVRGETGPSGGPALTDLLGICRAWDTNTCTIEPETGPLVTIALADIVSGKPVPPRPSVRHRVSTREAEGHSFVMFPEIDREGLGDWVLRSDPAPAERLYKRANSCLAMGDPGMAFAEAEAHVLGFYAGRGRDTLVQVEADTDVETAFLQAGWSLLPGGEVELRLGSVAAVRRLRRGRGRGTASLESTGDRAVAVVAGPTGVVAEGRAAIDEDWLGLHALHVVPAHRREGLAGEIVDELLDWGGERGASTVWLHVETDNAPARHLYDALGLTTHHVARYLTPPG